MRRKRLGALVICVALVGAGLAVLWRDRVASPGAQPASGSKVDAIQSVAEFVGSASCGECHSHQMEAWRGSQHRRAMEPAIAGTVLGDFADAKFRHAGVTSRFYTRDSRYFVNTDGADGKLAEFEIKYTYGVDPLQQYLIELPGGRLQALSIAWDSRSREQGGQRWFHLYPGQQIHAGDRLHWTGIDQNWNFMCADCHSTNVRKGFNRVAGVFETRLAQMHVGCEACHGPASNHLAWTRQPAAYPGKGLTVTLDDRRGVVWLSNQTGNAVRSPPPGDRWEVEVCAQCHAQRVQFSDNYRPGDPFLDHYRPTLLRSPAYHADGQQREEVYTWASFLQSRMYAHGVTCSDCHEPHSLRLRAPGNAVCATCHLPAKYDVPAHHFHHADSSGAQCANCHMPVSTYMVIDERHDHSFRIPRPAQTVQQGVPNACNGCHSDRTPRWAAQTVRKWYGHDPEGFQNFADAFTAAANGDPEAVAGLARLVEDKATPAIVRASAAERLAAYAAPQASATLHNATLDPDALVRMAAARGLQGHHPEQLAAILPPLLQDPVQAVRIAAARSLAGAPESLLSPAQRLSFQAALAEYVRAEEFNADRPEGLANLGMLHADRGRLAPAEATLLEALKIDRAFTPASINLADIYRQAGMEAKGEEVLIKARATAPGNASVRHALGLAFVRQRRMDDAVAELCEAVRLEPAMARYAYVCAVALHDSGKTTAAIDMLERSHRRQPHDRDVLTALVAFERERGNAAVAARWAQKLASQ